MIGYGSQGRTHALNLRDSGVTDIVVGLKVDSKTRALAADCVEEMGGLAQVWNGHLATWAVERIHGEPDRFASATRNLMEAVARRVDREERELYPVAEAVADRAA